MARARFVIFGYLRASRAHPQTKTADNRRHNRRHVRIMHVRSLSRDDDALTAIRYYCTRRSITSRERVVFFVVVSFRVILIATTGVGGGAHAPRKSNRPKRSVMALLTFLQFQYESFDHTGKRTIFDVIFRPNVFAVAYLLRLSLHNIRRAHDIGSLITTYIRFRASLRA